MKNTFAPKSIADFMLLITLIVAGSTLNAVTFGNPVIQQSHFTHDDNEEEDEPEYIFLNHIPASTEPLIVMRIILEFIGSNEESNEIYVEPTDIGDPIMTTSTLLNDDDEELVAVNLKTLVYQNGTIEETYAGSYNPLYFEQPGTFEFNIDQQGNVVLEKDGVSIPMLPPA